MSTETPQKRYRKIARYRCNQKLCVRYRIGRQDFIVYGRCTEVGSGGLGAEIQSSTIPIEETVRLELSLDQSAAPVALKAEVKGRQGTHYAFRFLDTEAPRVALLRVLFTPDAVMSYKVFA